ncbi:hypothetical protein Bpfe_001124 [Biomphalaria pfeifferi]|uniref:Uncharacterized protein n=1 Tax=Biomphalaria pfeifferi TaxID=112525 RepID=A0AAD8FM08_BIOPF|nr:hypothetical protein Bpfe_001124 [Biomphalaria pfeifferi]
MGDKKNPDEINFIAYIVGAQRGGWSSKMRLELKDERRLEIKEEVGAQRGGWSSKMRLELKDEFGAERGGWSSKMRLELKEEIGAQR